MNQNVIMYLQENMDKYSKETLIDQLRKTGYSEQDIQDGVLSVYNDPSIPAPKIRYAGFWIRFVASFIDGMVLIIPSILVNVVIKMATFGTIESIFTSVSGLLVSWVYYILMTDKYQATLGKKALGLKVISSKSESLTMNQIIIRETIGKLISSLILGIGYIMAAFTEKKEALHDKMADTNVVYR